MKKVILTLLISMSVMAVEKVDFQSPKDGAEVKNPIEVKMMVEGMKVIPAGKDLKDKKSGHHHLLIDTGSIPAGQVIPADEKHLHFGKGQTETKINLPPGEHELTLQFADGAHRSYGAKMSHSIKIKVLK
ncbi:MAG: DUF4399 domain-containing protein [Bdellovibrionales bacterium]|nr:DUF4399 domain-containing protein [Bdellovibrionales bacterium]